MQKMTATAGLLVLALLLVGAAPWTLANEKLNIYTVNYPLAYFAERIAGDLAVVTFPTPPDADPAFWMPDTRTIAAYQAADLILLNGADYAKWTIRASLPRSRLVDTSRAFKDQYIQQPDMITHSHGPGGQHAHGGTAFTTWLDLHQAAQQAEAIAETLARKRPEAKKQIEWNLEALKADLLGLDERIGEIVRREPGLPLLASHPVYQYLAQRYSLNLKSVIWEPDTMPTEAEWQALAETLKTHPSTWMLWEDRPLPEIVQRLQKLGVQITVYNPCGSRPETGNFLTVMSENVEGLKRVFRKTGTDHVF